MTETAPTVNNAICEAAVMRIPSILGGDKRRPIVNSMDGTGRSAVKFPTNGAAVRTKALKCFSCDGCDGGEVSGKLLIPG